MGNWIQDTVNPVKRGWEEFYRNRWQYDKTVRSTHGNNCTGGCSWMVYVKDGIITWELQAVDYEKLEKALYNILSNAFKYSEDDSRVSCHAEVKVEGFAERMLVIEIFNYCLN